MEVETRKNEFLSALQNVEALEYQAPNAQELVQAAIDRLPLIADYSEAASYSQRLNDAITRISSLPTAEIWEKMQAERQVTETQKQASLNQQIALEQQKLSATLNREQWKWNANAQTSTSPAPGPSPIIQVGEED